MNSVPLAIWTHSSIQASSDALVGSMVPALRSRTNSMASATQSTWNSWAGGWLVNGPIGPKIMKRFGKPAVVSPTWARGPVAHFWRSCSPLRPRMSILR